MLAYTAPELAKALCISTDTLQARVDDGSLPQPRKLGGRKVWPAQDVEAALNDLPIWGQSEKVQEGKYGNWRKSTSQKASRSGRGNQASDTTTAVDGQRTARKRNA